jgi:hypothetical protein
MKRYSVFVSSTLRDTREPRNLVIGALLTGSYIPIGMEFSPSTIKETKSHIEELIALSDYVCLIIKSDYGDIPEGMTTSWIHFEYEVAKRHKRPIIAFAYNGRKRGAQGENRTEKFVQSIETDGTTLRFWKTSAELGGAVLSSLKILTQESSAPGGWVRREAYIDEEDSLEQFYRRSSDYDYSDFLTSSSDIRILLNDGYGWRRRHEAALAARFKMRQEYSTTIITSDDKGEHLEYVAAKSQKGIEEQRADIVSFHEAVSALALKHRYTKLRLLKSKYINTHCVYICKDYAIETPYYTTFHRFVHLPLFRYRSGTGIYDDIWQDFELIARPLLAKKDA